MKYLKMIVDGETKEQLASRLHFLTEYIQEGYISGSGRDEPEAFWFFIKEEEVNEREIRWATHLRVKISARGQTFEQLATMLEEFRRFIAMGCCGGMTGLPALAGSASYIVYDRVLDSDEKGENDLCND